MKKVAGYVLLTAFLFGTMEVALKVAAGGLDAFQLTFLRFLIGGLFLLPFGIGEMRKAGMKIERRDLGRLLLVGIIGIPISMVLFQLGVIHSNAATAAVLFCINPLFTMIIGHFFAGEVMSRGKWASFVIGLLAMVLLIRPWDIQEGNTPLGMAYSLLGAITFSVYTVLGKKTTARYGATVHNSISFLMGVAVLLAVIGVLGKPVTAGVIDHILLVLYVGIFVTGVGYWSLFQAIKHSDAGTGSVAFFIKTGIAPIMAMAVLHEHLPWNVIVGMVLVIAASVINLSETRKLQERESRKEQV